MHQQNYIYTLPFYIPIAGNQSIDLHFSNSIRHFNIKCKTENPEINICLIDPDGNSKEFDYNEVAHSINGRGYEHIKFVNKSNRDILLTLDK